MTEVVTKSVVKKRNEIFFAKASEAEIWTRVCRRYLTSFAGLHFENEPGLTELDAAECRRNTPLCMSKMRQCRKRYSDVIGQAIQSGRLFQHPPAAIQISNTKKEELQIIILVKFFFFSVRNLKYKCGLSEVIVKNGGGRMLEQPFPMSSTLRASARSLGFLMGYN